MLEGICQIVVGVALILTGIFGDEFHSTDIIGQASLGEKLPKKSSQAFFIVGGLCFVEPGVKLLSSG